ncbi:hypothetical protein Rhopal_004784-T1 [Rhodotorula paludigena]|uniref:Uncharacterized protein n=1 Tax=Rhodotorula paludigena TaxID=86838 RepID=A0AAV5GGR8_9BASI|nr:hypothetical protein Rhopal_004784-T1 [Rhodotorula paludigena]
MPFNAPTPNQEQRASLFPPLHQLDGIRLEYLELDAELAKSGATLQFQLAALRGLGHEASLLTDDPFVDPTSSRSFIRCKLPSPPLPPPTHVLDIHFTDGSERYRVAVHGLLWALQCPPLSHLSQRPEVPASVPECENSLLLAVERLDIPCRPSWPLLHRYIYDGSPAALLEGLLKAPTASPLTSAKQTALDSLSMRLARVREVWIDAASLEMSDPSLWKTLERAWAVLIADLQEEVAREPSSREGHEPV